MDSFLGAVQQFFQWAYEGLLLPVWAVLVNFFTTAAQTISFIVTQIVTVMVPSEIYTLIVRWVFPVSGGNDRRKMHPYLC